MFVMAENPLCFNRSEASKEILSRIKVRLAEELNFTGFLFFFFSDLLLSFFLPLGNHPFRHECSYTNRDSLPSLLCASHQNTNVKVIHAHKLHRLH